MNVSNLTSSPITQDDLSNLERLVDDQENLIVALEILNGKQQKWPSKSIIWNKIINLSEMHNNKIEDKTIRAITLIQIYMANRVGESLKLDFEELFKLYPSVSGERKILLTAVQQKGTLLMYGFERCGFGKCVMSKYGFDRSSLDLDKERLDNDKEIVLEAVKQDGSAFEYAHNQLKKDPEFVLEVVKQCDHTCNPFKYASKWLRGSEEFVLKVIKIRVGSFSYASEKLQDDKDFVLKAIEMGGCLGCVSRRLRNDTEVVLKAVKEDSTAFEFASERLKDDKEVVLKAVQVNRRLALKFASERLKDDKEVVLKAVQVNGRLALKFASERLKDDKEVVLKAVKKDGNALEFASNRLKDDKEVVLEAVQHYSSWVSGALEFASERLKDDKEVVLKAVENGFNAFEYASEKLKKDPEFVLQVVLKKSSSFEYASEKLKTNNEYILRAIQINCACMGYVSKKLRADKDFVLKAIQKNKDFARFGCVSDELWNDKEFMIKVVQQNGAAAFISGILKSFHTKGKLLLEQKKYGEAIEEFTIAVLDDNNKEAYTDRRKAFDALSPIDRTWCFINVIYKTGDLQNCGVTDSDVDLIVKALLKGMGQSEKGYTLDLRGNLLTSKASDKLIELIFKNPFVTQLRYDSEIFSTQQEQIVQRNLEVNTACYISLLEGIRLYEKGLYPEAVAQYLKASNIALHYPFISQSLITALHQCQSSFPSTHKLSIAAQLPLSKVWILPATPSPIKTMISLKEIYMVSGHEDGTIVVWDITTKTKVNIFHHGHKKKEKISHLLPIPGSKTEFLSFDGLTLERWDIKRQGAITLEVKGATAIECLSDGSLVWGDSKGILKFIDPIKLVEIKEREIDTGYSKSPIRTIKALSDTAFAIGYNDGTLIYYDLKTKIPNTVIDITEYLNRKDELNHTGGLPKPIIALARLDQTHWASGSEDGIVRIWNDQNVCVDQFEADSALVYLNAGSTGQISIGCQDGTLHYWHPSLKEPLKVDKAELDKCLLKEKLKEGKYLGGGTFGNVYQIDDNKAMKVIKKGGLSSFQDIESEKEVMWKMRHYPTVMSLDSFFENNEEVQLVMERMPDGALVKLLEDQLKNNIKMSLEDKYALILDIVYGVLCLHANDIVHRDINTANIFINMKEKKAKIGDLGTSRSNINRHKGTNQKAGTNAYLDPWFLCAQGRDNKPTEIKRFSKKCDIYSLGVVIWELLNEKYEKPWFKFDFDFTHIIEETIIEGKHGKEQSRLQIPKSFPPTIQALLPRMWEEERNKRPNIVEIYEIFLGVKSEFINKDKI